MPTSLPDHRTWPSYNNIIYLRGKAIGQLILLKLLQYRLYQRLCVKFWHAYSIPWYKTACNHGKLKFNIKF